MSTRKPRLNVDLLDRTMAEVAKAARRKTQTWDQEDWRRLFKTESGKCGTAMCFAGWACTIDGAEWAPRTRAGDLHYVLDGSQLVPVWQDAERRLGLTTRESCYLFAGPNSLKDLRAIIGRIKAGEFRS